MATIINGDFNVVATLHRFLLHVQVVVRVAETRLHPSVSP